MRPLGVGLIYLEELEPLFHEENSDLSVLELEPEGFWEKVYQDASRSVVAYRPNAEVMERVAALPQQKLLHSVGFPVGGSVFYPGDYVTPLASAVRALGAHWMSEHLSFNAIDTDHAVEQVGLLLPPRQTMAGVHTAVCSIQRLASQLPVPFAFETGVNYLKPRADEMSDGEFFASIADAADCGVLLDLHNLWVNERNGRQPVAEVLDALPLDRVWEIHLAGGMMLDGYYLDAHSDGIPAPLLAIASGVIPRLANLGALMFEVLPGYVSQLGLPLIREQLSALAQLWRLRPAERVLVNRTPARTADLQDKRGEVGEWEHLLATLAIGHHSSLHGDDAAQLAQDGGIAIWRTLVNEARDGRIARAMRFTITLLLRHLGQAAVHELLDVYHATTYPDIYTAAEADRFAEFLKARQAMLPPVPYLEEVLAFEHALVRASLFGASTRIEWEVDPAELFAALESGGVASPRPISPFAMEITATG